VAGFGELTIDLSRQEVGPLAAKSVAQDSLSRQEVRPRRHTPHALHWRFVEFERDPLSATHSFNGYYAMYAIITDGGRQYKVEEGQELEIDYRDLSKGDELKFDRVLALSGGEGMQLGSPSIEGASVTAEVLGVAFGKKLAVHKLRRRKNSRRKTGHRQLFTKVRISKIAAD
jgi:large subunit ribosomal protein L21